MRCWLHQHLLALPFSELAWSPVSAVFKMRVAKLQLYGDWVTEAPGGIDVSCLLQVKVPPETRIPT